MPLATSCFLVPKHYKMHIKTSILKDEEVAEIAKNKEYKFDQLYRINQVNVFNQLHEFGIDNLQFVNLYDPNGILLKSTTGNHCEIELMSFLTDSLQLNKYRATTCSQCNYNVFVKQNCHLIGSSDSNDKHDVYHVVISWGSFLNQRNILGNRTNYVTQKIPELKKNNINIVVVGLNLDPPFEELKDEKKQP